MILNHVSVGVSNVASAVAFYDSVLSALSVKRSHYIENVAAAYGADDFMLSHGLLLLLRDLNTPSMADGHVKW